MSQINIRLPSTQFTEVAQVESMATAPLVCGGLDLEAQLPLSQAALPSPHAEKAYECWGEGLQGYDSLSWSSPGSPSGQQVNGVSGAPWAP